MMEANGSRQDCCKRVSIKKRIDYFKIFSLVVNLTTIRVVLGIIAAKNLHLKQLDVKTTFLHGNLEEEIYMQ
jgi:ATP-binding cassette subfamily B (MDR/TAP) protein 1